jgi:hypothetical protein
MRLIYTSFLLSVLFLSALPVSAETDPVVKECLKAIERKDFEAIEGLRDKIRKPHIAPLAATWKKSMPWETKDAYIALLMDQLDDVLAPMMEDALDSPTVESRAYALMILKKDFSLNKVFWDSRGWIIQAKVDAAVRAFKKERK